ncbi:MAG: transketolase [Bdellovibrio sp. CG12_big_fil_rev_8_21_14_0_65_39_13]|nr:MAG: transketolase [Bdellovibrio sp. CG22_combo_CG10-13_8_21_14_all_39_27]PIQ57590.1 MAG: transketolase [Bdellovibrio sp. CG12_big_fil_rev_8_21_14_0_65_39_13]PIR33863.1 MAG: transketolase [Bdellovibrio sp. CG11_big_fil_rev_8_21_14_0_20_39_38]PJB53966.1 MAG: transketolase [Bdellovibrio sp. CG_4_9_14_3_um_filter_39_7]
MTSTLKPLKVKNHLAPTPKNKLNYSITVKNAQGAEETLADPKATRALVALMNMHAVIGGAACHWGGPAAFAEIMSSVHGIMFRKDNWFNHYNFVNDAGHTENGIYALRALYGFDQMSLEALRDFRSIKSKLTGHGEAHLNPEGVLISNGPLGSGLPQAQGLALADHLSGTQRTTICTLSDGGAMEGEARESFAAIPGLAARGKLAPFVLLISDNNTKLSGRISEDAFDMHKSFEALSAQGWEVRVQEQGHNLQKVHNDIEWAIQTAEKNPKKPIAVVFKTIKGYGVKATEEAKSGGHGYPLKAYDEKLVSFLNEIYGGEAPAEFLDWAKSLLAQKPAPKDSAPSAVKKEKVQPGFSRAATRLAGEGLPLYSVTADLQGSTGIADFQKQCPNNWIDVGVAESNMISTAVGLSRQGFIPVVDTFAQFGITKGNLPLIMSQLSLAPVLALFSHIGFQDAADGASHQATTYVSAVAGIPNTAVICCASSSEAEKYFELAVRRFVTARENDQVPESVVFFFGREDFPASYSSELTYEWGRAQVLRRGSDVVIAACASTVPQALLAADELAAKGIKATVINNPFVNHVDTETFGKELAAAGNKLITVEDHQVVGGMGSLLVHALAEKGIQPKVRSLGIHNHFGQSSYKAVELYHKHGFDSGSIAQAALEIVK